MSRSSAEAEYQAMADTTAEMLWLRSLLTELGFSPEGPMQMYCDNMAATFIASNATFHMRTKHIEIDCHFIRQYVVNGTICTPHVTSSHQLADIFTKALPGPAYETIRSKLGMFDLHAPAWGGVLKPIYSLSPIGPWRPLSLSSLSLSYISMRACTHPIKKHPTFYFSSLPRVPLYHTRCIIFMFLMWNVLCFCFFTDHVVICEMLDLQI